ncbi:MAG: adenine phosphoribosyltransferase [Epsilonproteobacteria bacterium]|nr:adenine phosphoribosyltransferase [Campylobacterota bacterium]
MIEELLKQTIRTIPNFPKEGIMFKDITTLLNNPSAFKQLIDFLYERYKDKNIDYVAGIESRGFIFGSALAYALNAGFVPIRKKGKLPYKTVSKRYELEYGYDEIEIHVDAFRPNSNVLLIDDLIATGGTAAAAVELIKEVGANVVEACFIIELTCLNGRDKINAEVFSILKTE